MWNIQSAYNLTSLDTKIFFCNLNFWWIRQNLSKIKNENYLVKMKLLLVVEDCFETQRIRKKFKKIPLEVYFLSTDWVPKSKIFPTLTTRIGETVWAITECSIWIKSSKSCLSNSKWKNSVSQKFQFLKNSWKNLKK